MKQHAYLLLPLVIALAACGGNKPRPDTTMSQIRQDFKTEKEKPRSAPPSVKDEIGEAMLPPLQIDFAALKKEAEPRFNLAVAAAPASLVFMALVSDTKYSMLLPPDLSGTLTINLKEVTMREALETIRELYGYEYKIQGNRIFIQSNALQTRVFQVNYLASKRQGTSELSVAPSGGTNTSGSSSTSSSLGAMTGAVPVMPAMMPQGNSSQSNSVQAPGAGSRVQTSSDVDFWSNLETALNAIVSAGSSAPSTQTPSTGNSAGAVVQGLLGQPATPTVANAPAAGDTGGRPGVILNRISGIVVVRAMPKEMRLVENYLKATQTVVERQVMLEAKIIEVSLYQDYQAGVNWSTFGTGKNSAFAVGNVAAGSTLSPLARSIPGTAAIAGSPATPATEGYTRVTNTYDSAGRVLTSDTYTLPAVAGQSATLGTAGTAGTAATPSALTTTSATILPGLAGSLAATALKGFVGLAFQTSNFASVLNFLETQGNVQVLSSPRIATLNNQKAVLKVGTDEVYITGFGVSSGQATTGVTTLATATPTTSTLFQGISLDVMPQIDAEGNVVLHVHPAVSKITEAQKTFSLGSGGTISLPLASRTVNESDSIVRVQDGNIVAIGGLMTQDQVTDRSGLPGTTNSALGVAVGQRAGNLRKKELVILIKPTVISSDANWTKDLEEISTRLEHFDTSLRSIRQ